MKTKRNEKELKAIRFAIEQVLFDTSDYEGFDEEIKTLKELAERI